MVDELHELGLRVAARPRQVHVSDAAGDGDTHRLSIVVEDGFTVVDHGEVAVQGVPGGELVVGGHGDPETAGLASLERVDRTVDGHGESLLVDAGGSDLHRVRGGVRPQDPRIVRGELDRDGPVRRRRGREGEVNGGLSVRDIDIRGHHAAVDPDHRGALGARR